MKVRIALFSSLACLCSLVFVSPVRAQDAPPGGGGSSGQWVITYDYSVTGTQTGPNPPPLSWGQVPLPIDSKDTGNTSDFVGFKSYHAGVYFQTAAINYTNTITAHLKWMQVDSYDASGNPVWKPAPNAPKKVYIAKSSYVNWSKGIVGTFAGSTGTGSCSDGLGDTDAESAGGGVARGTHLIQKNGSSGSIDITCQQSANCTVIDGTPTSPYSGQPGYQPHYQSEAFVTWSFAVRVTDRGLTLHRDNAINETVDDDGTVHGDTTFSFDEWRTGPDDSTNVFFHANTQVFHPVFDGSWPMLNGGQIFYSPYSGVDWKWSPSHPDDTCDTASRLVSKGTVYLDQDSAWQGTPDSPNVFIQSYTATDKTDGATATANYVLTKHDEVENIEDSVTGVSVSGPLWGANGGDNTTLIVVQGAFPNGTPAGAKTISRGTSHTSGWYIEYSPDVLLAKFAKLAGLNFGYGQQNTTDITETVNSPFVPAGYYTWPIYIAHYKRHYITFRHYTPPGEHIIYASAGGGIVERTVHQVTADELLGADIDWAPPTPNVGDVPVYDPNAPPGTPPH